ncbi:MAG: hypothetical protein WAV67_11465 [Dokdonella sp.]
MVCRLSIVSAYFVTALVYATANAAEQPKVVCESDASGAAMNCRDAWPGEDAASFRRVAPTPSVPTGSAAAPTRPMLAPPQREAIAAPAPTYLRADGADQQPTQTVPAVPSTAIADQTMKATSPTSGQPAAASGSIAKLTPPPETVIAKTKEVREPLNATATAAAPTHVLERVAAEPVTPAETLPAPKLVDTPVATTPSKPAVPSIAMSVVTEAPQPVDLAPPPSPPAPAAVALLDGAAFRALDSRHFTLELANAKAPEPLRELAARLHLAGAVYLVHLRSPESDRWLLTWADYASQSEARSARSMVPADSAINSGWPRRIAPLQNELVSP